MDEQAIISLSKEGYGAREIAKRLGHKHQASVSKVLKRNGCEKQPVCRVEKTKLELVFCKEKTHFRFAAEYFARFFFAERGIPFFDSSPGSPFDLLIEVNGSFLKVQIKSSTRRPKKHSEFTLSRTRNNSSGSKKKLYSKEECDLFFLIDDRMKLWLIPYELIGKFHTVVPELRFPGYEVVVAESANAPGLSPGVQ